MTAAPLSFFTLDHGTASTCVSLVAPLDGRFRLLGSAAAPRGVEAEALLEDLVRRVTATEPGPLPSPDGWRDWARLESATREPIGAVCVAATERGAQELERAVGGAGWELRGRVVSDRADLTAVAQLCLDPAVSVVALASADPPGPEERAAMPQLAAFLGAMCSRRDDLWALLSGGAVAWSESFPAGRAVAAPAPLPVPSAVDSPLRQSARDLASQLGILSDAATPLPDGRVALATAVVTLARLLDRRVEAVDIGHAAGSRTLAHPSGVVGSLVSAEGALVPASAMRDDREVEAILRWTALRSDPLTLVDRVRNLRLGPWRDAAGDGARLRLTVLRAALARLERAWHLPPGADGRGSPTASDLLIACGGAFSALPPPAAAMALVDTLRRPGAMAIFHDHARLLAPIGTLPEESDRRRLLADLLDEALLPLGSVIVAGDLRSTRHPGRLRLSTAHRENEMELVPGSVRMLDLPPGVSARLEIEARDGHLLGARSHHVALELTGGLGGLLVDTREVPLRLPDRAERRRALVESWERPVWAAAEP
jgi:hypothetical protein